MSNYQRQVVFKYREQEMSKSRIAGCIVGAFISWWFLVPFWDNFFWLYSVKQGTSAIYFRNSSNKDIISVLIFYFAGAIVAALLNGILCSQAAKAQQKNTSILLYSVAAINILMLPCVGLYLFMHPWY
jgi:succinate dehydrogenase/fumarate reductase cytochrome b subunit